jgi:hypothetical protein
VTSFDRHPSVTALRSQARQPRPGTLPTEELRRTSLWDKLPWLLTALGLISAEWLLRRWRGLA